MANTKTTTKSKVTDKKVVKKDGKVTVTYKAPYKSTLGTYPSKVRKIYDNKGNLVKGNQRVEGSYGSSYDIGIKGKKATEKVTSKKPAAKKPVSSKNVTSKEGAAKIKGIVEGMERPTAKKTTTKAKSAAPKMATTIGSAKVSVPSKGKVKIEANTGKPKSFTAPKTEVKKAAPKVAAKPAAKSEPIKMETIPLAQVAQDLKESRPMSTELAGVKPAPTVAKTSAPVEENTGVFARMKQKREDRKQGREYRREARQAEKDAEKAETAKMKKGGIMKKYKTGGMVNSNANLQAGKVAGSKGVTPGVNPKAAASKVARGRVGGTSTAPKTAIPKAKYGMSMTKMKKK
jgi:hypothetical protein